MALRRLAQRIIPVTARRKIVRFAQWPPVGLVRFGSMRRLRPIGSDWGSSRGQPIDRYYIERFLGEHAEAIRGHVLEIGTNRYTRQFGGERVTVSDVLHVAENRPEVTIIANLEDTDSVPADTFDCIILTQTLNAIYDVPAALQTVARSLKVGGTVLATVPGISKISRYDMDRWGYYWSFTTRSIQQLFASAFPGSSVTVEAHGNVLAAVAFLHGLSSQDLRKKELDYHDPDYQLLITIKATKVNPL